MFIYLDECADEDGAEEKEKWKGNFTIKMEVIIL